MTRLVLVVVSASLAACGSVNSAAQCGDGTIGVSEECDEGAQNGTASSCCSAACTFVAAGVTCRASQGACDQEETCSGGTGSCPADVTMADGMACSGGNGVSTCSLADTCLAGACVNNDKAAGVSCASDACHLEVCSAAGACPTFTGKTVTITNSSAGVGSENMDTQWKGVSDGLGNTSTIVPANTLDSLANLANTDILIVSSGTQFLTATQRAVVAAFFATGRGVYVQGEYQAANFEGNIDFIAIANANGAGWTWGTDITGQFNSVTTGCFATTPNAAATPFPQNFGATGTATGPGVTTLQIDAATSQGVTFSYCRAGGGLLVVKTDQDDIRAPTGSVLDVMRNILYRLSFSQTCKQT